MQLQSIEGGRVVNHHPLGVDLQKFCRREEVLSVFPGHGFMDGGCYALALALQTHLRGSGVPATLYAVGRKGCHDHIAVGVDLPGAGRVYLDADGMADGEALIEKMARMELGGKPAVIEPFTKRVADAVGVIDYQEIGVPARLLRLLRSHLGPVGRERLSLDYLAAPVPAPVVQRTARAAGAPRPA